MSRKELLQKLGKMVPPMLEKFHKGQLGRVAVIGGSEDYTGAPYFSAMASAKLGCDMSHIICEPSAGMVIKTYSPNLMVHPYMRSSKNLPSTLVPSIVSSSDPIQSVDQAADAIIAMFPRLHVLVIGPGLGRDEAMLSTVSRVISEARNQNLPFVLDADGLQLLQKNPDLVKGYKECILTPNVVEFARLAKTMNVDLDNPSKEKICQELASKLGGITIIQKGQVDYISNGQETVISDGTGGLKRSGGQGDTLTGTLGTFLAWRKAYHDRLWEHDNTLSDTETLALAAFGGSAVTRECSRLAFNEMGRSLQAGDLTGKVHEAFLGLIGEHKGKL